MKERPILFNGAMVRAIRERQKRQTRRVATLQLGPTEYPDAFGLQFVQIAGKQFWWNSLPSHPAHVTKACPYGKRGDRLWVRETFCDATAAAVNRILYRADGDVACRWTPSIHMPRAASRITLEITGIRIERLQDISDADARAEGCEVPAIIYPDEPRSSYSYIEQYRLLWESINGKGSWEANPWVWVIEFKPMEGGAA